MLTTTKSGFSSSLAQRPDSMFTRGAAAEIFAANYDVSQLHALDELWINVFHGVFGQFHVVMRVQIARWNNFVGVDMRARVNVRATPDYAFLVYTPHR